MRAPFPTFFVLDAAYLADPKYTLSADKVSPGAAGLRLTENSAEGSPNSLASADESMGGLTLPRGMAVDPAGNIYLLPRNGPWILRYDPQAGRFARLSGLGGRGSDARQFQDPFNIAVAQGCLYVADSGSNRVQVFGLRTLALVHLWDSLAVTDVCAAADVAYILDQTRGRVYRHRRGTEEPELIVDSPADSGRWSRILADPAGRMYLFDKTHYELSIYDNSGAALPPAHSAEEVRDQFPPPIVRANYLLVFKLPDGRAFDLSGRPATLDPAGPLGPQPFATYGAWTGEPLDSRTYNCQWHRIELEADLPSGTRVVVSTYTDTNAGADISTVNRSWEQFAVIGPIQSAGSATVYREFLIQSSEGQFLWLRLELESDGYATPVVRRLRVHYPRESYLQYLPAVYSSDPEGRRFLDRFLAVFKTEWDSLERRNAEIARYFDPKAVPAGPFLDWLAAWLGLPLEQTWGPDQKRRLLESAPKLYPRLGTPEVLRDYVLVYAQNAGATALGAYPMVIEGFRVRRQIIALGSSALGREGSGAPIWSAAATQRLQLGVSSRVGEARLVSSGSPETDFFTQFAYRFQVLAPSAWVKTAADETKLRRAIDSSKPAQSAYELRLIEPRFRVGVQSTVGLDTILGGRPVARLASAEAGDEPPSRPPRNRLGYDTVLAPGPPADAGFRLPARGVRAGVDTFLR